MLKNQMSVVFGALLVEHSLRKQWSAVQNNNDLQISLMSIEKGGSNREENMMRKVVMKPHVIVGRVKISFDVFGCRWNLRLGPLFPVCSESRKRFGPTCRRKDKKKYKVKTWLNHYFYFVHFLNNCLCPNNCWLLVFLKGRDHPNPNLTSVNSRVQVSNKCSIHSYSSNLLKK